MKFFKTVLISFLLMMGMYQLSNSAYINSIGAASTDESTDIAIDFEGNYIITGSFEGTVDFDPGTAVHNLVSNGQSDIFVAKYDYEGNYLWAFAIGGAQNDKGNSVSVDYLGDIFITGYFNGIVDFDPSTGRTLSSPKGGKDIFVAKYTTDGTFQWVNCYGSTADDEGIDINLDFMGYPFITGYFNQTINLNPITPVDPTTVFTSRGSTDIFILCLSDSGFYQFGFSAGGAGADCGNAVKPLGDGGFAVGGYFAQTANFGVSETANLVANGTSDAFLVKYDFFQSVVYTYRFGDTGADRIRPGAIAIDDEDNLYFGG